MGLSEEEKAERNAKSKATRNRNKKAAAEETDRIAKIVSEGEAAKKELKGFKAGMKQAIEYFKEVN